MTMVFILGISLIVASNILLAQFFYEQSIADNEGRHYYAYYLDTGITISEAYEILDVLEKEQDVQEFMIASKGITGESDNDYLVATYLKTNTDDEEMRNQALTYGVWQDKSREYIEDNSELDVPDIFKQFECSGEGTIRIGSKYSDYRISELDFWKLKESVDAIEITVMEKCSKMADTIISNLGIAYESEYEDIFLKSGFESVKYFIIICLVLLLISLYSMIAFVEMFLHMQRQDIVVFYRCGATMQIVRRVYFVEIFIAGLLSFACGGGIAWIIYKTVKLELKGISLVVLGIVFGVYMLVYMLETYIYIRQTLKILGSFETDIE